MKSEVHAFEKRASVRLPLQQNPNNEDNPKRKIQKRRKVSKMIQVEVEKKK